MALTGNGPTRSPAVSQRAEQFGGLVVPVRRTAARTLVVDHQDHAPDSQALVALALAVMDVRALQLPLHDAHWGTHGAGRWEQ